MRSLLILTLILAIGGPALASDGMIEINHFSALAGGVNGDLALDPPGYPVTITQSGSYQLTGHMVVPNANTSGLVVTALRTTIDFGGFEICGPNQKPTRSSPCTASGPGRGVLSAQSVTVRNGRVSGMGDNGLELGASSRVESMVITQNCGPAVLAGASSIVKDTHASFNEFGIIVGSWSRVLDSTADQNNARGISVGSNSIVNGCVATFNFFLGISIGEGSQVSQNVAANNDGDGIFSLGGGSTIVHNATRSNAGVGINGQPQDGIGGNTVSSNGSGISNGITIQCNSINGVPSCP